MYDLPMNNTIDVHLADARVARISLPPTLIKAEKERLYQ